MQFGFMKGNGTTDAIIIVKQMQKKFRAKGKKSSAYNNSHGKATPNSLDKASMTTTNRKALNAEPCCILNFTSKPLLFLQGFCTRIHRHDCQY